MDLIWTQGNSIRKQHLQPALGSGRTSSSTLGISRVQMFANSVVARFSSSFAVMSV
jgi:hypothetical protein